MVLVVNAGNSCIAYKVDDGIEAAVETVSDSLSVSLIYHCRKESRTLERTFSLTALEH